MKYINMDIAKVEAPAVIMHGVNCQRVMKSGVAKALFTKWPQVKEEYMKLPDVHMVRGAAHPVKIQDKLYVVNCYTQKRYGYDGFIYAEVGAIEMGLEAAINLAIGLGVKTIYSPKIGCGLGGLDWEDDVQPVFEKAEQRYPQINITICDFN